MNVELLSEEVQKVLFSAIAGAIIGLEREWSGKSAGFRTMMLVCLGSTLFTIVSYNMAIMDIKHNSDVTRIGSNIATGIGFIGAGLIFRGEKSVHGLTTAATVWAAAAIGMAIGIGNYWLAIVSTLSVWAILVVLYHFTKAFEAFIATNDYHVLYQSAEGEVPDPDIFFDKRFRLISSKIMKAEKGYMCNWTVRTSRRQHKRAIQQMLTDQRVIEFTY